MGTQTPKQKHAADPNASAWVSANAGTGKTTVLVDRVLRLLLEGNRPSHILCLTFTKAAAANMRMRILHKLGEWATQPDATLVHTIHQLTGKPEAVISTPAIRRLFAYIVDHPTELRIQTIHAFCESLLKRFPLEAGLPPHFQLMEDQAHYALKQEAIQRVFSASAQQENPALQQAIRTLILHTSEFTLRETLNTLVSDNVRLRQLFMEDETSPEAIRQAVVQISHNLQEYLQISSECTIEQLQADFCQDSAFDSTILKETAKSLENSSNTNQEFGQMILDWLASDTPQRIATLNTYLHTFLTEKGTARAFRLAEKFQKAYPKTAQYLAAEAARCLRYLDARATLQLAERSAALLCLAGETVAMIRTLKAEQGLLDFDDLIHHSVRLLQTPGISAWVMYKLDEGIHHILVDEAQDTSPDQWMIIQALAEDFFSGIGQREETITPTFFAVGDEKQSIYGFRGADVERFSIMQDYFRQQVQAAGQHWYDVTLDRSFRSTPEILALADEVFKDPQYRQAISSAEEPLWHDPHRIDAPGRVELWLETPEPPARKEKQEGWKIPDTYQTKENSRNKQATQIARTIKHWMDCQRTLPAQGRPVRPGDILILLKDRASDQMHLYLRELMLAGLPVAGADRLDMLGHIAVEDMLALVEFLLLPEDDYSLACVLKSPLAGLTEEDLFTLSYGRDGTLWESLRQHSANHPEYQTITDWLNTLLNKVDFIRPFDLFMTVLEQDGGRERAIARLGQEVNDPLDALLDTALRYEQQHPASLQGFLHWVRQGDTVIKRDAEEAGDKIRIMTVHGAKGLQAPIVFLPDIHRNAKGNGSKDALIWPDEPAAPSFLWWQSAEKSCPTPEAYLRVKQQQEHTQYREYLRLLYVAITRAEDELYICSSKEPSEKGTQVTWYALLHQAMHTLAQEQEVTLYDNMKMPVLRLEGNAYHAAEASTAQHPEAPPPTPLLPAYFHQPAPQESIQKIHSITASQHIDRPAGEVQKQTLRRGNMIHQLLHLLRPLPQERRQQAAEKLLADIWNGKQRDAIIREVLDTLLAPALQPFLHAETRSEVALTGMINGHYLQGQQIDLLSVTPAGITIIDFKTDQHPPEDLSGYRRQLAVYRALVAQVLPGRPITTALFWTASQQLSWVETDDIALAS
ncbi:MAG: double-strand break repair helicase AddA [Hyphomicrobiales bacterium]|nr:double-strand break repair helicase AddA [Hyphomicrobiales bacterium]